MDAAEVREEQRQEPEGEQQQRAAIAGGTGEFRPQPSQKIVSP